MLKYTNKSTFSQNYKPWSFQSWIIISQVVNLLLYEFSGQSSQKHELSTVTLSHVNGACLSLMSPHLYILNSLSIVLL